MRVRLPFVHPWNPANPSGADRHDPLSWGKNSTVEATAVNISCHLYLTGERCGLRFLAATDGMN